MIARLVLAAALMLGSAHSVSAEPARAGSIVRDCAICPQMVVIPVGAMVLGSTEGDTSREGVTGEKWIGRDKPQYTVTIRKPFAIGRYEVTVGQYRRFARATNRPDGTNCWIYNPAATVKYTFEEVSGVSWRSFAMLGHKIRDDEPVSCVSWGDAIAFTQWLSDRTGETYRLPSEGEWEYAARAGSTTSRFWGDDRERACAYSNIGDLSAAKRFAWRDDPQHHFMCDDGFPMHAPVGTFQPNSFGLYDTQGNVYEWVQDCFSETNSGAPTDGSARSGPDCTQRALRGGGFGYYPHYERTSFRIGSKPDYYSFLLGFRVARDLE